MDDLNIKKYKKFIIETCASVYKGEYDIAVVGSRVRNDYTEKSDFDVVIFAKKDDVISSYRPLFLDGLKFIFNKRPIECKNSLSGYQLSYYDLLREKFVIGKDDEKFLSKKKQEESKK